MKIEGKIIEYDSREFKIIFDRLFPSMSMLAARILRSEDKGKDIAQEAFVKLWNKDSEDFKDENALRVYLYVLVKNACITQLRREKNIHSSSFDEELPIPDQEFLNEVLREETYQLLRDAIKELPPQGARVIELSLQGYKIKDVAEELGVSVNTVKTLKKRAYNSLREKLGDQFVVLLLTNFIQFF